MRIFSQTKAVRALAMSDIEEMYGLMTREFLGMRRERFMRDLSEKDAVMLLHDSERGSIVGFSTLMTFGVDIPERNVKIVFSGDTAVHESYRASSGFGHEIGKYFLRSIERFPEHEIYYVLISKGWRTYRIMPFTFVHFAPAPGMPVATADQAVLDAFGRAKYPHSYCAKSGTIPGGEDAQRLIPGSIDAEPPARPDAMVDFFLRKNPAYLSGTELVCVAPVRESNFATGMARLMRMLERVA